MAVGNGIYRYIVAEHIIITYMMAYSLNVPTKTQYIERRIAAALGVKTYNQSTCLVNKSSPEYEAYEAIQRQSAMWMLYIFMAAQFPALFTSNVLGALCDRYGRRIACGLPCLGLMLNYAITVLVVTLELPLAVLLAGSALFGTSGHLTTFVVGCSGYISDATEVGGKERTVRFVLVDVGSTLTNGAVQFAIGYVIAAFGFATPFYAGMVLLGVCSFFVVFCLPDRRSFRSNDTNSGGPVQHRTHTNPLNIVKNVYSLLRPAPGRPKGRAWRLCAYNFIICVYIMQLAANSVISVLYTTGEPFCMDTVEEGHFGGSMFAIYTAGNLFAGTVLHRFFSPFWILHLTSVSAILSSVLMAFAKTTLFLYICLIVGMFTIMALPLSRNGMANLVGPDEQGVLFAFSGTLTSLSAFVTPLIFNAVYSGTLSFMPGFSYLLMALVLALAWVVIVILHVKDPKDSTQHELLAEPESDDVASSHPNLKTDATEYKDASSSSETVAPSLVINRGPSTVD